MRWMRWMRAMVFRVRALLGRGRMDDELREEMDFHLEMETRKHQARGLSRHDARQEALRLFGGVDRYRERTREAWGSGLVDETLADVRYGLRQLVRRPGFAALALGTLGLGIGATTALVGTTRALLLEPLPLEHGERMVAFWSAWNWRASEFDAIRELELEAMEAVAAYTGDGASLQADGRSVVLTTAPVTPGALEVLGVRPALGRGFVEDDHAAGAEDVVLIGHGLWRTELGGDPEIVGRRIELDGAPATVVGVMPEDFWFPTPEIRMWRPLEMDPSSSIYDGRGWLVMTARLREGAGEASVQRDLERITRMLGERFEYPAEWDKTVDASVRPLRHELLGETRPALLLLLGAALLLLLTACANVAALLTARTADRAGEMAVRAGLGAGRGRLARQFLTEGAVLGVLGGLLGAAVAAALHGVLAPALPLPEGMDVLLGVDAGVLLLATAVSGVVGVGIAAVPLRGVLLGRLAASLGGARSSGGTAGSQRLQSGMVAAQVMLAVMLVSGATLLVRSVDRLMHVDLGLQPRDAAVGEVFLGTREPPERQRFVQDLVERLAAVPGVDAVGTVQRLPLRQRGGQGPVWAESRPDLRDTDAPTAYYRTVTPGTFAALGTPMLSGRDFTGADRTDAAPVAIVSRALADVMWPGQDPVGQRVAPVSYEGEVWTTVVGVVDDIRYEGPDAAAPLAIYRPMAQTFTGANRAVVMRAEGVAPATLLGALRREAAALDPGVAVHRTGSFEQVLRSSIARPLRLRLFLALFGGLALVLGMVGVYGMVSYAVSRRQREYGLRMALGAAPRSLVGAVVGRGMLPVAVGVVVGVGTAAAGAGLLASFLFGVERSDPLSFGSAAALLLLAGGVASLAPALRASRVDPSEALRAD